MVYVSNECYVHVNYRKYNTFDMQHRNLSRFDKNKSDEEDYLWRDLGDEAKLKFLKDSMRVMLCVKFLLHVIYCSA